MIRVALRGLAGRKMRAALTAFAIILGVAMVSGTYVLTDTIDKAFDNIFSETYANTDAVVSGKAADISFQGESVETPPIVVFWACWCGSWVWKKPPCCGAAYC